MRNFLPFSGIRLHIGIRTRFWGAAVARGCDCAPAAWLPQNMGTAPCPPDTIFKWLSTTRIRPLRPVFACFRTVPYTSSRRVFQNLHFVGIHAKRLVGHGRFQNIGHRGIETKKCQARKIIDPCVRPPFPWEIAFPGVRSRASGGGSRCGLVRLWRSIGKHGCNMPCRLPAASHRVAGRVYAYSSSAVGAILEKRSIALIALAIQT